MCWCLSIIESVFVQQCSTFNVTLSVDTQNLIKPLVLRVISLFTVSLNMGNWHFKALWLL